MAIYNEKTQTVLLEGSSDPNGDPLLVRTINGAVITQWPHEVDLPVGRAMIAEDGVVTYDDEAQGANHPDAGVLQDNGTFTFSLWDGALESPVYTATLGLSGLLPAENEAEFGRDTRAGAGGVAVEGLSIVEGDPNGLFQITGGMLSLSAAGEGSALGLFALTLDNSDRWNISVVDDMYHVASASELEGAIANAKPRISSKKIEIVIRDGSVVGTVNDRILMLSIIGGGSLNDPNEGASDGARSDGAYAAFGGGHLVIRPETPLGATIRARLEMIGCDQIHLKGLNLATHVDQSQPAGYLYDDNLTGNSNVNGDYFNRGLCAQTSGLTITSNGTNPLNTGSVIVEQCNFGAPSGVSAGHFTAGVLGRYAGTIVLQGNNFTRVWTANKFSDVDRIVLTNNWYKDYLEDCVQAVYHRQSGANGTVRIEAVGNYFMEPKIEPSWAGAHSDAIQIGTDADLRDYSIYYANNIVAMMAGNYPAGVQPARVSGGTINHQTPRRTQGFWMNFGGNTSNKVSGRIANNFVLINAYWAVNVDNANGLIVEKNTILRDFQSTPNPTELSEAFFNFRPDCTNSSASNNISGHLAVESGAAVSLSGNYTNLDSQAQLTNSYPSCFAGPFTMGSAGVRYTLNTANRGSARASVDAVFAPRSNGPGNGKGHLA